MANRTVSPSTRGVRPAMKKMYDGRNVATRPIPIIVDTSDLRAIAAAAADSKPKLSVVNMPMNTRIAGNVAVFGTVVPGSTIVNGGVYNPAVGGQSTI